MEREENNRVNGQKEAKEIIKREEKENREWRKKKNKEIKIIIRVKRVINKRQREIIKYGKKLLI